MEAFFFGVQLFFMCNAMFICSVNLIKLNSKLLEMFRTKMPKQKSLIMFRIVGMLIMPSYILSILFITHITNMMFTCHLILDVGTGITMFATMILGLAYTRMPNEKQEAWPEGLRAWLIN